MARHRRLTQGTAVGSTRAENDTPRVPRRKAHVLNAVLPNRRPPDKDGLDFVRVARSAVGSAQSVVQRVGNAIIGGDFTGNARGENALDFQVTRQTAAQVASGDGAVTIGLDNTAAGQASVAIGSGANAQAVAYLELRVGEKTLFGVGMDSNIVSASLKAIVSGVQRSTTIRKNVAWQTS